MLDNERRLKNTIRHFEKFADTYYQRKFDEAVEEFNENPELLEVVVFTIDKENGFNIECYVSYTRTIRVEINDFDGTYGELVRTEIALEDALQSLIAL